MNKAQSLVIAETEHLTSDEFLEAIQEGLLKYGLMYK